MDTISGLDKQAAAHAATAASRASAAGEQPPATAASPGRRVTLLTAPVVASLCAAIAIALVYRETAESIVAIWIRSETFAHGFLVVPLCLWLVWRNRDVLAALPARPWWPGLALVLLAGGVWFVMATADVLGLAQFGLAFMIQASVITIVGLRVSRALAFPLAFLWFAVPVGEIFVPTLIDWTADFTIAALRLTGIPVYREGNHFVIPTGMWSIVEACSGIRYIIASVMVGVIYAAVAYRSARRRALFIAASIAVPILANWLRAYLIVLVGHLSHNQIAVGVDHIIYGWVFFGVVMLLLFWVGSFWSEDRAQPAPARDAASPAHAGGASAPGARFAAAAVACVLAAAAWMPLEAMVVRKASATHAPLATIEPAGGWQRVDKVTTQWVPRYSGHEWILHETFRKGDSEVGLFIAYYRDQHKGRELVTSGNQLTDGREPTWKQTRTQREDVDWLGQQVEATRARILGPREEIDAVRLFWVDGRVTSSIYAAKALLAWSRLTGRGDDAALIVMHAPARPDGSGDPSLRPFARDMARSIERALDTVRGAGR